MSEHDLERWVQHRLDAAEAPEDWEAGRADRMRRAAERAQREFAHTPVDHARGPLPPPPPPVETPAPSPARLWPVAALLAAAALWFWLPQSPRTVEPTAPSLAAVETPSPTPVATPRAPVATPRPVATPVANAPTPVPARTPADKAPAERAPTPRPATPTPVPTDGLVALRHDWPPPARSDLRRAASKGLPARAVSLTLSPAGAISVGHDVGFSVVADRERSVVLCVFGPESGVVWQGDVSPGTTTLSHDDAHQRFRFTQPGDYRFVLAHDADCASPAATRSVHVDP